MINKFFIRTVLILSCFANHALADSIKYQMTGVKGDVLNNIQSRLNELYEQESLTQESNEAITQQIEKAMTPYGYFSPRIRILSKNDKFLQAHINPGPQMRITALSVKLSGEGATNPDIIKAANTLPIKTGDPLLSQKYDDAKETLLTAAEHEGYLQAFFEVSEILIDKRQYTARISLVLNTGHQYYFGRVRFDKTYVNHSLLYRYLNFQPGQAYSTDQVLALESNLSASGYFKSVVVKPQIDAGRAVPIDVHLEPVHRINYALGIGYGTDTGPRGRASVSVIPVNRSGHKFTAIGQGSTKENALLAQYIIPGGNPITDNYSLQASVSNQDYSSGYGDAFLLTFAHQHIKKRHQRILSLNLLSERFNYSFQSRRTRALFYPKATFTWNKTTDPLFSPSGYNFTVSGFAASKAVLSELNVGQATIDAKAAYTFESIRTRFFLHGIQGATGTSNIYDLPLSLAMLLGGAENMKGYSFNSIGPGKLMTYGGIEIQKETYDKWYIIGFYDVGDVYSPQPRQLKYDAGIGLMWVSPIGPIKVAVAQPITSRFQREPNRDPRLVINMGPDL